MKPITFDSKSYRIDGQPAILHSGEFHYFRVPKADWRRRMELFREAGGNCIATYIPWLVHEPDEGRFVFGAGDGVTDLAEFLVLAAEAGLYVIAKPGPHQYSELRYGGLARWLLSKYPSLGARTIDGRPLGRSSVSYTHPLFLEKTRNWFACVCPIIAEHQVERGGSVAFVQLDNELTGIHLWNGGLDYNPESMGFGQVEGRFARFLANRHGGIGNLNRAWGTEFASFKDALPVAVASTRDESEMRRMCDYFEFYLETIADYVATLAAWAREFGITAPLMHNSANQPMTPLFLETAARLRAEGQPFLLGSDHYFHGQGSHPTPKYAITVFCSLEKLRLMGFPPTVMEMPSGAWQDWPSIGAEDHRLAYLTNLAYGLKGSNYYIFTGGPNPPDCGATDEVYDYNAPIGAEGEVRPLYHAQKEFGQLLRENAWLAEAEREHDCRFALDWDMTRAEYWWKDGRATTFSPMRAWELLRHGALMSAFCGGLSPVFVDLDKEDWTADRATPLVVVASTCMARAKQERIIRFLEGGGKALILPTLPELDERLKPCDVLRRCLGAPRLFQDARLPFGRVAMGDVIVHWRSDALFFCDAPPEGAEAVAVDTASGQTVGWRRETPGGGTALVLGLDWSHHKHGHWQLLAKALQSLGLEAKVVCSNPNVWTSLRTAGGRSMLFLVNSMSSPQEASLACRPGFLLGRSINAGHHRLQPLSVKCVPLSSVDIPSSARPAGVEVVSGPACGRPAIIAVDPADSKPLQLRFGYNNNVFGLPMRFNDPRFVEAIRESGASLMRFPGGTIANFYDWKTDDFLSETLKTVDPAKEVRRENYETDAEWCEWVERLREYIDRYIRQIEHTRAVRGRYGFDDFREMAAQANAEVLYVANVNIAPGRRDPADYVAEWMAGLKRKGIEVRRLELGNEISEGVQGLLNNLIDSRQYLAVCERAASQIKKIFPRIKIGIVAEGLGNRTAQDGAARRDASNHELFHVHPTNDFFDAIISHSYLGLREHVDYGLWEKAEKLFAYADVAPAASYDYWRERFPGKEVWMTEIGYFTNKSDRQELVASVFNALYENSYLLRWSDFDDVVNMYVKHVAYAPSHGGKSVLFGGQGEGDLIRHTHYHGFALVGGALKASARRLATHVYDDESFSTEIAMYIAAKDEQGRTIPGRGETRAQLADVPALMARAFTSEDGRVLRVAYVNRNPAAKRVRLDVAGRSLRGLATTVQCLTGNLTDRNTAQEPSKVRPISWNAPADGLIELPGFSTGVITVSFSSPSLKE